MNKQDTPNRLPNTCFVYECKQTPNPGVNLCETHLEEASNETPNTDEWLEDWFYEYATREPDDTFTLVLHEIHGWEEAKTAIQEHINRQIVEARIEELQRMLHKDVCEVMCGWSEKCDVQGEICPQIRKRLTTLTAHQANRNGDSK